MWLSINVINVLRFWLDITFPTSHNRPPDKMGPPAYVRPQPEHSSRPEASAWTPASAGVTTIAYWSDDCVHRPRPEADGRATASDNNGGGFPRGWRFMEGRPMGLAPPFDTPPTAALRVRRGVSGGPEVATLLGAWIQAPGTRVFGR